MEISKIFSPTEISAIRFFSFQRRRRREKKKKREKKREKREKRERERRAERSGASREEEGKRVRGCRGVWASETLEEKDGG